MAKKRSKRTTTTKAKKTPINYEDYPLIGYEYEYLSQPVCIKRVCPSRFGGPDHSHVEFETRFGDRSSCDSGELSKWQDIEKKLTKQQATRAMLELEDAIEDATTDDERKLAEWQERRLIKQQAN